MRISEVEKKVIYANVRERINFHIYRDESMERTLSMLNKARTLIKCSDERKEELKKEAFEIVNNYFENGMKYDEFCQRVFNDYPIYKDDYVFKIYLWQAYRELFCEYLHELEKKSKTLRKLVSVYKSRYR